MAFKVTLRQKPISENRKSLYLDFYPPIPHPKTGKPTRREFLQLYIYSPIRIVKRKLKTGYKETEVFHDDKYINEARAQHNQEQLEIAEGILQKKRNFLNKPEVYSDYETEKLRIKELGETDFLGYFKSLADKRKSSNHDNWVSAFNYLYSYSNGNLKVAELNEKFCEGFKEYLLTAKSKRSPKTNLSRNSAVSYFNKFKAALREAHKTDKILQFDLNSMIGAIPVADTKREYLTLEELNKLVETPCNSDLMKRAALFSALTGLRFSDIQKLKWKEIEYSDQQGYNIKYQQQKTQVNEVLPISEQAFSLLGERGTPDAQVFEGLTYSAYQNKHLYQWIGAAGITKDITFHCFRHTYATPQLANGTAITTVQKMLGHKGIKTTQIYAKVVDQAKREAADKIKLNF